MRADDVRCELCGEPVSIVSTRTCRKVEGWVLPRAGGGTNHLRLRRELHKYAHPGCVSAAAVGAGPSEQGELFG